MSLEGKRISELTEVSRVNKASKLPIDTGGEEALSITLENLMESGVNAAIETLQFITWVDVLPPTGSTKYLYAVPREETDTDGKQIAALYLWDGSAWRGAGAFSLNIDPDTLATKAELAGYLPLSGGSLTGVLNIAQGDNNGIQLGNEGTINSDNITLLGNLNSNYIISGYKYNTIIRGKESHPSYTTSQNVSNLPYFLLSSDKAVANGVASLDANAKVPENQLPDTVAYQAILREW